ncbi:DUF397 domain-containing protein [Lentzea sp. CC55]|nr:DUF397 domain-containing protein [Lentzea sp. CC55]
MAAELRWIRSSYSSSGGDACIEIAVECQKIVLVRDAKDQSGPRLRFSSSAWSAFVTFTSPV